MEPVWAVWPNGYGFASLIEHLMFAIVPGGLVLLLTPLLSQKAFSVAPLQLSGITAKAQVPITMVMISLQAIALPMRYGSPLSSDASFPAASLSLLATSVICLVLRSEYALAFRPVALPFHLLSMTLIYDISAALHCYSIGQWNLWRLQSAITALKITFIVLGRRSSHHYLQGYPDPDGWSLCLLPVKRALAVLHSYCEMALTPENGMKPPQVLADRFMQCWIPGER